MKKLIMPCMDIRHGKVVKGIKFKEVKDVADPVERRQIGRASCRERV